MIELKNKTRDLYSFSDTDLLMQMSWKDDPLTVSGAVFNVFFERYKDHVWSIVFQVCKNYTPRHGKQLPADVFNNTFVMVLSEPLAKMDHLEKITDEKALFEEVKQWLMQLAAEALRELMNGGEEAYRKHIVLKPMNVLSSAVDSDSHLTNEDNVPYNSDNLVDNNNKTAVAVDEATESDHATAAETDDAHQEDAPEERANSYYDEVADGSYHAYAAFEEEAEAIEYTAEQHEAARMALNRLSARDNDILMTILASEQRGRKTPRDVLESLRTKYDTTSDNLRAVKSRAFKYLREALGTGTKMRI